MEGRGGRGQLDTLRGLASRWGGGCRDCVWCVDRTAAMAAGLKKGEGKGGVRGDSEISDLATVSSWGVISRPTSGHVLNDHLGIWQTPQQRKHHLLSCREDNDISQEICQPNLEREGGAGVATHLVFNVMWYSVLVTVKRYSSFGGDFDVFNTLLESQTTWSTSDSKGIIFENPNVGKKFSCVPISCCGLVQHWGSTKV